MDVPQEHIFNLQASERYAAVREILQRLISLGALPNDAEQRLLAPSSVRPEGPTDAGFGLSLLAIFSDLVTEPIAALGRLKASAGPSSFDGRPVHVIGLTILPEVRDTSRGT
jgi:mannitol/fructose-specific phosphotransferase system IIA component (Ntr-type)